MGFRENLWNFRDVYASSPYMVKGSLNKQAAAELGVSEVTVKVHRHNIMQKIGVKTLPDLVWMVERLNAVTDSN